MAGMTTLNTQFLLRTNLWSRQIKELLLDELNALRWVRILSDFPDGLTINMPSIGEAEVADFVEGQAIKYNAMDTGNFTFSFDTYKYSANSISQKFKRDSFYSADVIAAFVPREHRALMEAVETDIFAKMNAGQNAGSNNIINTAYHRWVGQGSGQPLNFYDFAAARFALVKANVPLNNLVAVVDPTQAYVLETQTNVTNLLTPSKKWQELPEDGLVNGFKFRFNIYGFDVYESNYLPAITETIGSTSVTNGVANFFFSATPGDTLPVVGAFREQPTVYSKFNMDLQQDEYATFAEWGFKTYRTENLINVLTAATNVVVP
jgi:hypothetical protein